MNIIQETLRHAVPPAYMPSTQPASTPPQPPRSLREERLPFTIRPVRNDRDLEKALHVRHEAYARHLPEFATALRRPEADDVADDTLVLLAESKLDGSALGTVRIQTNLERPLNLEQSVELPEWLRARSILEVRRLAIVPGNPGHLVKMALIKGCFMYSYQHQIEWSVVAARPPLDRMYEKMMFQDVLEGRTFIPLPREHNVVHRVLGLEMETLESRANLIKHPLVGFFFDTQHPDVSIGTEPQTEALSVVGKRADRPQAVWRS